MKPSDDQNKEVVTTEDVENHTSTMPRLLILTLFILVWNFVFFHKIDSIILFAFGVGGNIILLVSIYATWGHYSGKFNEWEAADRKIRLEKSERRTQTYKKNKAVLDRLRKEHQDIALLIRLERANRYSDGLSYEITVPIYETP
jgi:hypothetical protein